jgi:hypothetical protein
MIWGELKLTSDEECFSCLLHFRPDTITNVISARLAETFENGVRERKDKRLWKSTKF